MYLLFVSTRISKYVLDEGSTPAVGLNHNTSSCLFCRYGGRPGWMLLDVIHTAYQLLCYHTNQGLTCMCSGWLICCTLNKLTIGGWSPDVWSGPCPSAYDQRATTAFFLCFFGGCWKQEGGRSWSVLKEDYMMGASSMKVRYLTLLGGLVDARLIRIL